MKLKMLFKGYQKENEIVRKFRDAGACSFELARPLSEVGVTVSIRLRKLVRNGVIVNSGQNSYFLDEQSYMNYKLGRFKWAMILLFAVLGILFLLVLNK